MSFKFLFLGGLLLSAVIVNLLGVFGPELGFDALWYHLTIPKLYLQAGKIYHIPGGLLYYSELPRLGEIIYLISMKVFGDLGPHIVNWGAGVGMMIILYKLSRTYLDQFTSLLVTTLLYITPLVGWQSGSAYVDLLQAFFEILAFCLIVKKKVLLAGLVAGLIISTKTFGIGSLGTLAISSLIISKDWRKTLLLIFIAVTISLPWFLSSFLNTGYPFYPIGAGILDQQNNLNFDLWNIPKLMADFWKLFVTPDDPITPIYVIALPFVANTLRKTLRQYPVVLIYCILSFLFWYIIPRTGGGRFILPYLPVWALLVGITINLIKPNFYKKLLITAIMIVGFINLAYRGFATARLWPVLNGKELKISLLCRNLDFSLGNFADCDGYLKARIKSTDKVYVSGIHNLYYVNFPFVHETWYRGEDFNYVLVQNASIGDILRDRKYTFSQKLLQKNWSLIYQNLHTGVKLYH